MSAKIICVVNSSGCVIRARLYLRPSFVCSFGEVVRRLMRLSVLLTWSMSVSLLDLSSAG